MASGNGKRIFFYVQHLLGIGHLVRASRIAQAMASAGLDVTMVTGGSRIEGMPGEGIRHVQLPEVYASNSGFSGLVDAGGAVVDEAFQAKRVELLLGAFREAQPHAVIIEAFPFGRRQMRFELLPLLEAVRSATPKPLLFSSVRDILQENRKPGRDEETALLVEEHFDGVLVHGDENFVRLEQTFPLTHRIAHKVLYTGLVLPDPAAPSEDQYDVVVSAGGGAVGAGLIQAALEARERLGDQRSWCVITGPNLPAAEFERLTQRVPPEVTLARFRTDFPGLLMNAKLSISQAGYNTVGDLLRARCASVLIPFASGGETEQTVRAQKLADLGFAVSLPESELNALSLCQAIEQAERQRRKPDFTISVDGASRTANIIQDRLSLV